MRQDSGLITDCKNFSIRCCGEQTVAILDAGHQLPFAIKSINIDLPELQGEEEDIAKEKCRIAASKVRLKCAPHQPLVMRGLLQVITIAFGKGFGR